MTWSPRRRAELPPDWACRRTRVLRRDGHTYRWGSLASDGAPPGSCRARATEVDHTGNRFDHRDELLRSLCGPHHRRRSQRQGTEAAAAQRKRISSARWRTPEQHPGGK